MEIHEIRIAVSKPGMFDMDEKVPQEYRPIIRKPNVWHGGEVSFRVPLMGSLITEDIPAQH